jgi:hypothetical protein
VETGGGRAQDHCRIGEVLRRATARSAFAGRRPRAGSAAARRPRPPSRCRTPRSAPGAGRRESGKSGARRPRDQSRPSCGTRGRRFAFLAPAARAASWRITSKKDAGPCLRRRADTRARRSAIAQRSSRPAPSCRAWRRRWRGGASSYLLLRNGKVWRPLFRRVHCVPITRMLFDELDADSNVSRMGWPLRPRKMSQAAFGRAERSERRRAGRDQVPATRIISRRTA